MMLCKRPATERTRLAHEASIAAYGECSNATVNAAYGDANWFEQYTNIQHTYRLTPGRQCTYTMEYLKVPPPAGKELRGALSQGSARK